jgi:hypothetical protein
MPCVYDQGQACVWCRDGRWGAVDYKVESMSWKSTPCPAFDRRIVAILAAYAIALQALLTAFAAPPDASSNYLTVICSGSGSANDGQPVPPLGSRPNCMACAASSCAVPPPAQTGIGVVGAEFASHSVAGTRSGHAEAEPARTRPQSPRAPPLGA